MAGIMFNGKEISVDELNAKMAELKALQGLQKEAKKAGLITKAVAAKKEKSANFALMLAQFQPVLETNASIVAALFTEFDGQDSISFDVNKEYHVIIRSKAVVKAKQEKRVADAKIAEEKKELATLKALTTLDEKQTARIVELEAKYPVVPEPAK
jgi:hypothetical protein